MNVGDDDAGHRTARVPAWRMAGMTRRDWAWRSSGFAMLAGSCVAAHLGFGGTAAGPGYFIAAIVGIVLLVNGHRVLVMIQAERRGHAMTAQVIHARRIRRYAAQHPQGRR
ncbi:hypothetical protein [uncultured Sphingomonas sp.]|uniref:hypothetical protein n=1 Tax=uncultured Sphingomonas sp. TaxID=158754 RepID=UPI0035CA3131